MPINFLIKHLFDPLYYLKNRSPLIAYWKNLEKSQYLPVKETINIQWFRLKSLYSFLWKNNSFYKQRFLSSGLTPDSLKEPCDIAKLPLLTKKDVRNNLDAMISDGIDKAKLLHFKTGGSTGKALDIYISHKCSALRNACTRRHDRWTGWEPGDCVAAVWGNPELPQTFKEKLKHKFVLPRIYLDTMSLNNQSVRKFVKDWDRHRPKLLFGHAHSLYLLAKYLVRLNLDHLQPVGILSTSMMLLPHERAEIEKTFKCKVTDRYGCEEVGLIGCECERHEGLHMNIEHLVIEFLKNDGSIAKVGEPANIIVTDLFNYAMPFVRYQLEDIGIPVNKICSCGRSLPLMSQISGRTADFLIKKDKTLVAGISLIENSLTKIPGIDQMQIIQDSLDSITLNIVTGSQFTDNSQKDLLDYFSSEFSGINISICLTDQIFPEPSGKYRFSINKVSNKYLFCS